MAYFVHGILRDPDSFNGPYSLPLGDPARLLLMVIDKHPEVVEEALANV
jgi:hypothetical protein